MNREDIIRMGIEAGLYSGNPRTPGTGNMIVRRLERFADLVAAAERKVIMDSLQKQADMATDALDRRWALEMIAAVAARSSK